ncbi:MAG: homocysteine S-methyltransferase [Gammaproteobacteria bacterium]|nr:homocysteine S-methyltransferase [Gammaproteobacteria bacterium]MDH5240552.1 homocysteine S-methyltransferase [Gammaproteobacteria bacterium]MDH5259858.1 homocysteine S-methyltransferase [Gammaproteobacteria bacterium]MDH5582994.1 homocysteine S-methyltransferase [Gammaproteobacteria bacterium]
MHRNTTFTRLLERNRPLLLDGGLATQLEAQGCDISNDLWSASLLQSNPEAIVTAHRAYLDAGAECLATASYQASRQGFGKHGMSCDEADAMMLLSVALAKRARREAKSGAAIAASLGPYGAMLHDGSEYVGNYGVSSDTLREFHEARLKLFDDAGADVLALETIPSLQEAEVIRDLLRDCQTPSWVSFSCRDSAHISDGALLSDAARLFAAHPTVVAVGINCTSPQHVPALLAELGKSLVDMQFLAYPNSGEVYDIRSRSWSGTVTPGDCAAAARSWIAAGATIVGGCCRMGPRHIEAMAAMISGLQQQ